MSDGMFVLRLFPRVIVDRWTRLEERGVNVTRLACAVHTGTHLDAPRHFFADGATIDEVALEACVGEGVAWKVDREAGEEITVGDLERSAPAVEAQGIVLISTGWARYFASDPGRYIVHPYLSLEAAGWLIERRVRIIGMDVPTVDLPEPLRPSGFDWPVHRLLLANGVLIAEHVADLTPVVGRRFRAFAFPLAIRTSDGSPVRLVAELDE